LHSGMDFDWAYPSLFVQFALLAALLTASTVKRAPARTRTWQPTAAMAIAGMAAAAATVASWHGIMHLNVLV
ncbi:MAG TPA: hypothetical protein VFH66_04960, partial [Mycobacteriales bacterium]|nr:hypothetical protein [Mycobacteriales bacterium]